jgi:hypothetical protein
MDADIIRKLLDDMFDVAARIVSFIICLLIALIVLGFFAVRSCQKAVYFEKELNRRKTQQTTTPPKMEVHATTTEGHAE